LSPHATVNEKTLWGTERNRTERNERRSNCSRLFPTRDKTACACRCPAARTSSRRRHVSSSATSSGGATSAAGPRPAFTVRFQHGWPRHVRDSPQCVKSTLQPISCVTDAWGKPNVLFLLSPCAMQISVGFSTLHAPLNVNSLNVL